MLTDPIINTATMSIDQTKSAKVANRTNTPPLIKSQTGPSHPARNAKRNAPGCRSVHFRKAR